MLGAPLTFRDIEAVDPDYYRTLAWMLDNDVEAAGLDLSFAEEVDFFGRRSLVELAPGGAAIKVTNANKRAYVDAVAAHRMTTAAREQIDAFLGGFYDAVPRTLVRLFTAPELELLTCGLPEIDPEDLRAAAEYHGGYTASSPQVVWLWAVVRELDAQGLARLVQFVAGSSKVPLGGFTALQGVHGPQRFQVHRAPAAAPGQPQRLPTAHTCFNQLDLPEYGSKAELRERLTRAIMEGAEGFGFA
jgi:hypothetical protein